MSQRVLIRHSTGSKALTTEEFPVTAAQELTFGRDATCDIRFDKDRDEFVSRHHMKLVVGDPDRMEFTVVDLSARNGTFVNRRRVLGSTTIRRGDVVQLGAGGPEFTFDVAEPDFNVTPVSGVAAVEELSQYPAAVEAADTSKPPPGASTAVQDIRPSKGPTRGPVRASRKNRAAGAAILVLLGIAGLVYLAGSRLPSGSRFGAALERGRKFFKSDALKPEDIARQNAESTVTVENSWRLIDPASGRRLRQIYIVNRRDPRGENTAPLVPSAGAELPVFVLVSSNRLQPLLTTADHGSYRPIAGTRRSAGFVISSDGLVLTGGGSATPWSAPYDWPAADSAGVVAVFDSQSRLAHTAVIARRQFPRWIPTETDFVLDEAFDQESISVNSRIRGTGVSDSVTVRSSARQQGAAGTVVTISEQTGLATVRLNAGITLRKPAMAAAGDIQAGDELVFLTPPDGPSRTAKLSILGDGRYSLPVNAGAAGGMGAPVFDRQGRIVAVQTDVDPLHPDRVVAIPIRRALESVGQALSARNP